MTRRRREPGGASQNPLTDPVCACATARQVARVLTQWYDDRLRASGLEAPQFALLMTLDKQGPCSQVALGRRYALDKTTVSRNLKVLQRNGWIEASVATDRRERQFTLTTEGRQRLAAAKPEWKKAQDMLRSAMTSAQWDAMFEAFTIVTKAATNLQGTAPQKTRAR